MSEDELKIPHLLMCDDPKRDADLNMVFISWYLVF